MPFLPPSNSSPTSHPCRLLSDVSDRLELQHHDESWSLGCLHEAQGQCSYDRPRGAVRGARWGRAQAVQWSSLCLTLAEQHRCCGTVDLGALPRVLLLAREPGPDASASFSPVHVQDVRFRSQVRREHHWGQPIRTCTGQSMLPRPYALLTSRIPPAHGVGRCYAARTQLGGGHLDPNRRCHLCTLASCRRYTCELETARRASVLTFCVFVKAAIVAILTVASLMTPPTSFGSESSTIYRM